MSPKPTGHVSGNDLILTRTFRASIDDVWTSVTDSESTARVGLADRHASAARENPPHSTVIRPRPSLLSTPCPPPEGERNLWTAHSHWMCP